jgi:hypothetical protein
MEWMSEKAVLRKQLQRAQIAVFFGNLPPCVIRMKACAKAPITGAARSRDCSLCAKAAA